MLRELVLSEVEVSKYGGIVAGSGIGFGFGRELKPHPEPELVCVVQNGLS